MKRSIQMRTNNIRSITIGLIAAICVLAFFRTFITPAEVCPRVSSAQASEAAARAVHWLSTNQRPDGSFLYARTTDGAEPRLYSSVRHAGVLLGLEQAARAGIPGARQAADRGRQWAQSHLIETGHGRALAEVDGTVQTGATALLMRALIENGQADPDEMAQLAAFLREQVNDDGSVASSWDPESRRPTGSPSPFATGQLFWALLASPESAADAALVGAYLPARDGAEPGLPVSDHWAALAYADLGLSSLSTEQQRHVEFLADYFGAKTRGEASRWAPGIARVSRLGPSPGSGVGHLGEGMTALLRLYGESAPAGLKERTRCVSGILVNRQAEDGAWYTHGYTQMDDQQHAISALLMSKPFLDEQADANGGGGRTDMMLWVLLAAALANPLLPVGNRRRWSIGIGAGLAIVIVIALPVVAWLALSPATLQGAAGIAALTTAGAWLISPRSPVSSGIAVACSGVAALGAGANLGFWALLPLCLAVGIAFATPIRLQSAMRARIVAGALAAIGGLLIATSFLSL